MRNVMMFLALLILAGATGLRAADEDEGWYYRQKELVNSRHVPAKGNNWGYKDCWQFYFERENPVVDSMGYVDRKEELRKKRRFITYRSKDILEQVLAFSYFGHVSQDLGTMRKMFQRNRSQLESIFRKPKKPDDFTDLAEKVWDDENPLCVYLTLRVPDCRFHRNRDQDEILTLLVFAFVDLRTDQVLLWKCPESEPTRDVRQRVASPANGFNFENSVF